MYRLQFHRRSTSEPAMMIKFAKESSARLAARNLSLRCAGRTVFMQREMVIAGIPAVVPLSLYYRGERFDHVSKWIDELNLA